MREKIRARDVFSVRFWINYLIILGVTCWVPLLSHRARMQDPDGTVLQESFTRIPVYRSYWMLLHGGSRWHLIAVAVHLSLCFVICFAVWYFVLRASTRPETPSEECATPPATT